MLITAAAFYLATCLPPPASGPLVMLAPVIQRHAKSAGKTFPDLPRAAILPPVFPRLPGI